MTITIVCPNGHRLKATEKQIGKSFSCPACGAKVVVTGPAESDPLADASAADPFAMGDLGADPLSPSWQQPQSPGASLAVPGSPAQARASSKPTPNGPPKILWIAGASGGAGLVLIMILIVVLALSRGGTPKQPEVTQASPAAGTSTGTTAATPTSSGTPATTGSTAAVPSTSGNPPGINPAGSAAKSTVTPVAAPPKPTEDQQEIGNKLRRIALAFHNFHDQKRVLAYAYADDSNPQTAAQGQNMSTSLSWRVHLLPYLEQKPLYEKFRLDEPWDSANNKPLLEFMPEIYRVGNTSDPTTRFQVITGPDMLFGNSTAPHFANMTDGMSNTILTLVVGPDKALPWTKPDELRFDPNTPLSALGTLPDGLLPCIMADAKGLTLRPPIDPTTLLALATPAGNEIIDANSVRRKNQEPSIGTTSAASGTSAAGPSIIDAPPVVDGAQEKLKAIGFAFLMHREFFNIYVPPEGNGPFDSHLSWRVHLLPFLGENALYHRFHLNEPWDSPHNKTLLGSMPAIYQLDKDPELTRFRVFFGPNALFRPGSPIKQEEMKDGFSTILATVVGKDLAVPWTRPEDLPCDQSIMPSVLQSVSGGKLECVLTDGTLLSIPANESPQTLEALATPAGGEILDVDALRKKYGTPSTRDDPLMQWAGKTMKANRERQEKLKTLILAMFHYTDTNTGQLPVPDNPRFVDQQGRARLSWRVHLLPFLEQNALYQQFKLDEPWDSPSNLTLLDKMPDVFRDELDPADSSKTRCITLTGPDSPFPQAVGMNKSNMKDGAYQTLLIFLAGTDRAVPWTKPDDIVFDAKSPWTCLGTPYGPGWYCVTGDGAVRHIKTSLPNDLFKALVTPSGGETLPNEMPNFGFRSF